jgi:LAO/AO transport system kinase
VDKLIGSYRGQGLRVAVVAVDPSSAFSGGAILGDRIRMQDRATDPGVYIRSMATRGHMGGLAVASGDALTVLDAAGFDVVLLETVGVGQDEVDVVREADTVLVVLVPGMGDDIQAIKAGIMEIADVFVVNKADREGVDRVERELHALLTLPGAPQGWTPPVVKTVASRNQGMEDLLAAVERHREHLESGCGSQGRLRMKFSQKFRDILSERFLMEISARHLTPDREEELLGRFLRLEDDPYTAAEELLRHIRWK